MSVNPIPTLLEHAPCPLGCPPADAPELDAADRLHGIGGRFTVVRCRTCGLLRTDPRPTAAAMGRFYPDDYKPYADTRVAPRTGAPRPRRHRFWKFDPMNQALPELAPGRLLEIGCGSGKFLDAMAAAGWIVRGLEPSAAAARAAQAAGLDVRPGSLESIADIGGPYDLVVGWMVLEHLHDPIGSLRKLRAAVTPAGWLAVSVPDAGSWEFRHFRDAWYALQVPTHLYHFTPATLAAVLATGGWRVERVIWQRDAKNLLNSLRYRCLDRGWTRTAQWLADLVAGRRLRRPVRWLARLLGWLRASGRLTVWARPA